MSRISDEIHALEQELDDCHIKIEKLEKQVSGLECDNSDYLDRLNELEQFEAFVEEYYPEATQAYAVRQRMETASGKPTPVV